MTQDLFVYPMDAALTVSAATVVLSFTGRWRIGLLLLGLALVAFWLAATPVFANWLTWRLESVFPSVDVETLPQSDVVILLGGVGADLNNPANRITHALQIYSAGKAPCIVISSGNDAKAIADELVGLGVPGSALIVETGSRNTRENAVNTAAIFKAHNWRSGLLVTSAAHMPRAVAAFQKVGLSVVPAATAMQSRLQFGNRLEMDKEALLRTTATIREMFGLLVYRYLGWA